MTRTFHKIGDQVYYEDSENPGVYRKISGYDTLNAPSNATIQTGPNQYNTPENIQELKKAEEYFAEQKKEEEKRAQREASKPYAQRQAEAQAQVTSVPHVTSPAYSRYLELKNMGWSEAAAANKASSEYNVSANSILNEDEIKKKTAQTIAEKIAPTIATNSVTKIIEKIKKETIGIPATREARIDEAMHQLYQQQTQQPKIATPITPDTKKIEIAFPGGGIASILVRAGSALWDFASKNPKTIGATISTTAFSNAITQTAQTEGEKNQILWEIGQQNPQLVPQIVKEMSQTKTSPFANMADIGKYAVIGIGLILLYSLLKRK